MKDRLARTLNPKTGRTVMLAFDHGYIMRPTSGLERLDLVVPELAEFFDCLMETPFKKPKGTVLTESQLEFNRLLSAVRVRVEHCIGWVKNWMIIGTRFRCALQVYTSLMQVVAGLGNWQTQRWQQAKAQMTT